MNLVEYDVERDRNRDSEMVQKSGRWGVPFIDIEGIYMSGFSEERIRKAVEQRRAL